MKAVINPEGMKSRQRESFIVPALSMEET